MKKLIQFCLVFITTALLYTDCKKTEIISSSPDRDLIIAAKDFFTQSLKQQSNTINAVSQADRNPRKINSKTPLWSKVTTIPLSIGKAVLVPVQYNNPFLISTNFSGNRLYSINQITRLLIYRDKEQDFHSELLTFFPDSSFKTGSGFTGILFVEDWAGNNISEYRIEPAGYTLKLIGDRSFSSTSTDKTDALQTNNITIIQTCYEITGYNYSSADPGNVYYWSEPAGCTVNFINDNMIGSGPSGSDYASAGSGSGGGGISPAGTIIVNPANNIIGNIKDYNKCFTNVGGYGHTYTITICVDQPVPGTREAWGFASGGPVGSTSGVNPFNVGHVFLIFSEATPTNRVTRNVGFYPANSVSPRTPAAPGQLNNDGLHAYNVSLTISTTNSQFFNMLNFIELGNSLQYNLNYNNCSSFALHTLYAGGIYLPSTLGTWPGGSGNDPGDLGEDIRSMTLQSNMIRNVVSNYHPNLGNCN
jgi:hypothetical protein